eukprot:m51a1_g3223 hypothetical protein (497) ;mRNA; r:70321-74573
MIFLCNQETINPILECNAIMDQEFRNNVPEGFSHGGSARAMAERTLQALVDSTPEFGKEVEMRLMDTMKDPHVAGWTITTHQQTIDGIPIVGAVLKAKCVEARRVVLRPGMANGEPGPNLPAWEVLCGTADVYVSTQSPSVYDKPTGAILWKSGQGSSSDPEINAVVDGIALAERIWKSLSGRDCYDNKGSTITVFMHFNMSNAYYTNRTMSFGLDFVARSILWHEYGHGITEFLDKANASNPIWVNQVKCPVPASLNTVENVTINLGGSSTSQEYSMPMYWASAPVLDKALLAASNVIDIYSQNLISQAGKLMCDDGATLFMLPCIMVFLCNQETINPIFKCNIIMDLAFRNDVPGVLRATVHTGPFTRGKHYVYATQHGLNPISNAVSFTAKNANASLQICFDLEDVHVVVSEPLFGSINEDTDSSGCVKFDLEQGVEYNVSATKDKYLMQAWQQTLTNSTVLAHYTMVASAGQRASAVAWQFVLSAIALIWAL